MKKGLGIGIKMMALLLPVILIAMAALCAVSSFTSSRLITEQIGTTMEAQLHAGQGKIDENLAEIKSIAQTLSAAVGCSYTTTPLPEYEAIFAEAIKYNEFVIGSGIWFAPYVYDPAQEYVGPYIYKDGGNIVTTYDYSNADYDYFSQEYYTLAQASDGSPIITDPYFDETSGLVMSTCTMPIYNAAGTFIGCISVDTALTNIQDTITSVPAGENGYAMLVTASGTYLSCNDNDKITNAVNITEDENASLAAAAAEVLASPEGQTTFDDHGRFNLYYSTVDATGWKIMIAMPQSELNAPVHALLRKLLAVSVIAIILCALIVVIQVSGIARNIRRVSGFAQSLASGDFTIDSLKVRSRDELGQMGSALNNMYGSNKDVITNISDHASSLTNSSQKLNFAAENLNREFADIHHHIADVNQATLTSSAATEELNASAENVKSAVIEMTSATADSLRLVDDIKVRAQDVEKSSEDAYNYASDLAGKFRVQLTHSIENARVVDEVSRMASAISAIASQINLLSLNASVEAARAGEHGKGFAVVASEVGSLASQTSQTVRDIEETIEKVQAAFDSLSKDSQELLTFLTDTVAPDYQRFVGIGQQYQSDAMTMGSFSTDIAQKSQEIEHVIKEMVLALQDIAESSGNTAASSSMMMNAVDSVVNVIDEVSTMSGEQNKIATNLNSVVNQFKL